MMRCYCCGSEITAPQFHNGKAYGFACILKVAPGHKRKKAFSYVQADAVEDVSELTRRALINGKWYQETRTTTQLPYRYIRDDGIVQITQYRPGSRVTIPVWKGLNA